MRIGIDGRLWNETGVGRYIRNLVAQLQEIDTTNDYVLFLTPQAAKDVASIRQNKKWKIVETDIRWHTVEEQLVFYKTLEAELLDLVHFPYFSIPILYSRPYVITIHDLIINHFSTGKASTLPFPIYRLKRFGYQYILKRASKNAQKVLTVSNATKEEIMDHLKVPAEKIVVTYEGVDSHISKGVAHRVRDLEKYFLYVGNAYPHKNLDRLVEAFGIHRGSQVKLVLVGAKNYFYNQLEEKVHKLKLDESIVFAGKVSDQELGSLYKNAEAVVLPSLMEGFGLPGLEAMQQDCLVLASDIPVFHEIYGESAVYFDPLDVGSIRATIQKVLDGKIHPEKYISQGKKQLQNYSWEHMAKQTLQVYESCISLRSGQ